VNGWEALFLISVLVVFYMFISDKLADIRNEIRTARDSLLPHLSHLAEIERLLHIGFDEKKQAYDLRAQESARMFLERKVAFDKEFDVRNAEPDEKQN
jgi:hypothetical protein